MADINITHPISIKMEIVETEDYLPSIKMLTKVQMDHSTGTFLYTANDVWFKCTDWDKFINELHNIKTSVNFSILLKDMSEDFLFNISLHNDQYTFELVLKESMGYGFGNLNYKGPINNDEVSHIVNEFSSFPKWW